MSTFWFGFVGILAGIGAGAVFQWLTYFGFGGMVGDQPNRADQAPPRGAPFKWRYVGPAAFAISMVGAWFAALLIPVQGDETLVFMGASFVGLGVGLYLAQESQYWRWTR